MYMQQNNQNKQVLYSFLQQTGIRFADGENALSLLARGGSDRSFYRIQTSEGSFVVMTGTSSREEVEAYVEIGNFLYVQGIGSPEICAVDRKNGLVLMEDLGDHSLYTIVKQAASRGEVTELYKKALEFLAEMQMTVTSRIAMCDCLKNRSFGYESFRGETDYFLEAFVKDLCGIDVTKKGRLEDELHKLAAGLVREPRFFMHRDLQSQNMYLKEDRIRIIDFQTATQGLLQYDLAACLKDAYVMLTQPECDVLLKYYMDCLEYTWSVDIDREQFAVTFHRTGLQRNMQALGAFAFLSMRKGKTEFLQHIPAALAYLKTALSMLHEFPALQVIVERAAEAVVARHLLDQAR